MARLGIREFYRKIKERIRARFKKKSKYNWPELDTYCGCCSLTTGIYIRSVINLVMTTIGIVWNVYILNDILKIRPSVFVNNMTDNESEMKYLIPQKDLSRLFIIYNGIITYYILWLSYKIIYVLIVFWTIFAIFKKSGAMMKILMCISIPNWILDILISFLAALIIEFSMRILMIVGILFEGYNILALNSQYKKIMGRAKVRHKDIESEPEPQSMPPFINLPHRDLQYRYTQVHCRGCNCIVNESPDNENGVVTIQPSSDRIQTTLVGNKEINESELNYAITGILNIRNIEESARSETVGSASGEPAVRPNTLDLTLGMVLDEKVVVTDEPIIYDVNQLNVGTSPVVEDREGKASS